MVNERVCAVIVTFNRKILLKECLTAIIGQSYSAIKIILIDNASTDGTQEMLKECGFLNNPALHYIHMDRNTGGAGGFYEGLKIAKGQEYDWVWVMDDDTIPKENCLEELLSASRKVNAKLPQKKISFMASTVYGENGEFMNLPDIDSTVEVNGYQGWYRFLSDGIVTIKNATFVSILISNAAIGRCGLPNTDFFIWGDDTEYTTRLTKYYGNAYFVGRSIAIHKRENAKSISILNEENPDRIKLYHYYYRNQGINRRMYEDNFRFWQYYLDNLRGIFSLLIKKKDLKKAYARLKGNVESIVQYKKFYIYTCSQLSK